jgi:GNAT superfamily N-acetyltransferase
MTPHALRTARPEDAAALARLARRTFIETFVEGFAVPYPARDLETFLTASYAPERILGWLDEAGAQILVAEDAGALVGFCHTGPNTLPLAGASATAGEIRRLYLTAAAQGLGLGRALMERGLRHLVPRPVFIGVWSGNHKALAFYARWGFAPVGRYTFAVGETLDDEVILGRSPDAGEAGAL